MDPRQKTFELKSTNVSIADIWIIVNKNTSSYSCSCLTMTVILDNIEMFSQYGHLQQFE